MGTKPVTFIRQVMAACFYPELLQSDRLPRDVKFRAQELLQQCGGSVGVYSDTFGLEYVQHNVARFIEERDGGVPCDPQNIYLTAGSQKAGQLSLKLLVLNLTLTLSLSALVESPGPNPNPNPLSQLLLKLLILTLTLTLFQLLLKLLVLTLTLTLFQLLLKLLVLTLTLTLFQLLLKLLVLTLTLTLFQLLLKLLVLTLTLTLFQLLLKLLILTLTLTLFQLLLKLLVLTLTLTLFQLLLKLLVLTLTLTLFQLLLKLLVLTLTLTLFQLLLKLLVLTLTLTLFQLLLKLLVLTLTLTLFQLLLKLLVLTLTLTLFQLLLKLLVLTLTLTLFQLLLKLLVLTLTLTLFQLLLKLLTLTLTLTLFQLLLKLLVLTLSLFQLLLKLLEAGGVRLPYFLADQGVCWELDVQELQRVVQSARGHCTPSVLYINNPGIPTGHVQSRQSIEEVIRFAASEGLYLLVDEVYQDSVFGQGRAFLSYKKVLYEMGPEFSSRVELAAIHSASKGVAGECGSRCGFIEFVNLDPQVKSLSASYFSANSVPPTSGQLVLVTALHSPRAGEPSYYTWTQESQSHLSSLSRNAALVVESLDRIPGIRVLSPQGGFFCFPRIHIPPLVVHEAEVPQKEIEEKC
ncbi:hypothetical protein EOD39_6933 [Acipenser ruthenus]|uniref:alanine transaminase n=1 Tax=Acipenser ruthenus TaxID=7906 RepID=A0A444U8R1_ACIRT|nr:hypothetical protein EOD39_6933 [Acipenser ruthenus]